MGIAHKVNSSILKGLIQYILYGVIKIHNKVVDRILGETRWPVYLLLIRNYIRPFQGTNLRSIKRINKSNK
jgi:hypothetical protein